METPKAKTNWGAWLGWGSFIFLALILLGKLGSPPPLPQTPDVVLLQADAAKGDAAARQRLAEMESENAAQYAALCHLRSVCKTYSAVRQDCATAGSFGTCVTVKMGDSDKDLVGSCT